MICERVNVVLDIRNLRPAHLCGADTYANLTQLETTPCHFGGSRTWFLCPGCGRRCAVLYQDYRCRKCISGRYKTELASPLDRKFSKSRKLRYRLGQRDADITRPIPAKPKRMQWHTYLRIRQKIDELEREIKVNMWR